MTTIAIIGALDDEVALIAASLNDVTHDRQAGLDVTRGTLGTTPSGRCSTRDPEPEGTWRSIG